LAGGSHDKKNNLLLKIGKWFRTLRDPTSETP